NLWQKERTEFARDQGATHFWYPTNASTARATIPIRARAVARIQSPRRSSNLWQRERTEFARDQGATHFWCPRSASTTRAAINVESLTTRLRRDIGRAFSNLREGIVGSGSA